MNTKTEPPLKAYEEEQKEKKKYTTNEEKGKVEHEERNKKKQKKSVSYALKAVITHFETLGDAGLIEDKEKESLNNIVKKAAEKFVKEQYGIG